MPQLYELGGEIINVVPRVHLDRAADVVVAHEKGKDALYPDVDRYTFEPIPIHKRGKGFDLRRNYVWEMVKARFPDAVYVDPYSPFQKAGGYFVPESQYVDEFMGVDILLFPRHKPKNPNINWNAWPDIIDMLLAEGLSVGCAGNRVFSYPGVEKKCMCAWDFSNPLDASITMMKSATIIAGPITALTLVSLMCKRHPHVVIAEGGYKSCRTKQKANFDYLRRVDHGEVGWTVHECWRQPDVFVRRLGDAYAATASGSPE